MASLSSSLSSLHSLNVSIAIQYGDENRRMWFPNTMPWSEVRSSILSCYLLTGNDYRFSYLDEEGDAIAIDQDNEYIEAKRSAASKGSHLQLSLVKIAQNGAADERSKDDFVGLEDNSDLEESYVSVNALSKPSPVAAPQEKKADDAAAPASDEDDDDDNIDDALTALQEAEQQQEQQIKMPVNEDAKESPPLPTPPPAMVQDSNVSPANNVDVVNEPKKSASMNAALVAISSVLGTGAAQEGLAKTVASSLINYCVSIASPTDAELIRSNQSLLEERVNDGVKGRINNALLARLLVRRLFIAKKKKIARSKKSPKSKPSNEDAQQKSPTISVASSSSSSSSGSGRAIHHNVRCDECNNGPIVGARYHCITCDENDEIRQRGGWDCCEVCETKTNHCSSGAVRHVLIKMKTPAKIVVEKEQPSPQLIASGHPLIYDAFAHFGDESKAVPLGVVRGSAAEEKDAKKKQKKGGKKYAKQLIQMLLQQFSDESFSCSDDSSSDDENAQRKLMKKMEKQKKKAEKAMKKAEKLKLKAEKKAEKTAEKSAVKVNDEKKEEESEKNEEVNKNEEKKEEVKEEPKEKQENEQPSNPSPVSENQSLQVESAAAAATSPQIIHNHEPIIKTEASSSSSSSSDSSVASSSHAADPSPKSSIIEQKAVEQPVAQPVPIPIAHPVIIPPSVPSLPAIIPAPLFPAPPSFLPPSNPFTFPAPSSPVPSPSMPSPPAPVPAPAPLVFLYSDQLQQLTAMGFPRERSMEILNYYSGDLRKALNRLL